MENAWIVLIISLPTHKATDRMRLWRALKSLGCGALRDGVYLLPDRPALRVAFEAQAQEVINGGGSAQMLYVSVPSPKQQSEFEALFDRTADYTKLSESLHQLQVPHDQASALVVQKALIRWRRTFEALVSVDFFPTPAREQSAALFGDLEQAVLAQLSPDEPHTVERQIPSLNRTDFKQRLWATRRRPWIDRLASAWLIARFIDPKARFLWLAMPADCPDGALGFDFDGAPFTHVGAKVTFEVLLTSFGLTNDPALVRIGALVHYLDVGGIPVTEGCGIETLINGLHRQHTDDDALLREARKLMDVLYLAYTEPTP